MSRVDRIWPLPGGIHPPEHKSESNGRPIARLPAPHHVVLPLHQNSGLPAEPMVAIGEQVQRGQLIAKGHHPVSALVHATISGRVTAIEDRPFAHPSGLSVPSIVIESLSDQEAALSPEAVSMAPMRDWATETKERLVSRIQEAGITGLGGAGFPSHIKYLGQRQIHTLIVNGVECEPYITADDRLMREHATDIVTGTQIALKILSASTAFIAIEDNKPEAISAIKAALVAVTDTRIKVKVVPTKYPSGGEKQLVYLLTGREVPSGDIPASLGIVMQNTGTLYAIKEAVVSGTPMTERVVTITGEGTPNPGNYWVTIGTPIQDALAATQVAVTGSSPRVIMGGPMMGYDVDITAPVSKVTNCLLVPSATEFPTAPDPDPCIRCGLCEQACPANLLPQKLFWNAVHHEWEQARLNSLSDCIECGACSWVCPSNITLVQHYRFAKAEIKREAIETIKADQSRLRFEQRQARLERDAAEKDAKRKARAAEAAKAQAAKAQDTPSTLDASAKDAILASVARAKAKKAASTGPVTQEALENTVVLAQQAVDKTRVKLATAVSDGLPSVEALTGALQKLEKRLADAQSALQSHTETGDAP